VEDPAMFMGGPALLQSGKSATAIGRFSAASLEPLESFHGCWATSTQFC